MSAAALLAALEALLREENDALSGMEIGRATALLADKQRLAAALDDSGAIRAEAETIARLHHLAEQNRVALSRALRVQRRMLDILSDAARRARAAPGYGPRARREPDTPAMMMRTRV